MLAAGKLGEEYTGSFCTMLQIFHYSQIIPKLSLRQTIEKVKRQTTDIKESTATDNQPKDECPEYVKSCHTSE